MENTLCKIHSNKTFYIEKKLKYLIKNYVKNIMLKKTNTF